MFTRALLLSLTMLLALPAHASMRCGTELAKRGDYDYQLLDTCGEPDYRRQRFEEVSIGGRHGYRETVLVTVETWIYRGSNGRFDRIVTLRDGIIQDIELGERR